MSSVKLIAREADSDTLPIIPTLLRWAETRRASMILFDGNGEILYTSKSVKKLLDLQDPLKGRRIGEIFNIISCDRLEGNENEAHHVTIRFTDSPQSPLMEGLLIMGEECSLLDLGWHFKDRDLEMHPDRTEPLAEFVAQIAHEIRNPLAGIGTTIDILAQQNDGESRKYCMLLKSEVDRVANMLKNLMNWCAPTDRCHGKAHFQETLRRCVDFLKIVARIQDITIAVKMEEDPVIVRLSETKLTSVLQNVMMNALESMSDGGRLEITGSTVDEPRRLQILITDTGRGIELNDLDSVFKPFWSKRKGGTGLGLAVTKRYISEAGGTIHIESATGQGTSVTINLPLHDK
ncbi:MAG: HAMP domain-containing sensor histidine kinase [Planctomycetota bacterium]